jgi:lipopolysaccharide transport system permease protein
MYTSYNNWRHLAILVIQKTKAGLRTEAARGYLGVLWWVIEPILYMCVFYVIAAHLFNRGDANFVMFLLTGLITWKWFASSVNAGGNSLLANGALINQVYLPKIVFPLIVIAINTFKFFVIFILFIVFILFMSIKPSLTWVLLPIVVLTQLFFITSVASLLAAIMPFFPDLRFILDNILLMLLFLSGIFFDINNIPEPLRAYLLLNPMALLITMYRKLLLDGLPPDFTQLLAIISISLMILILAMWLLHRFDRVYPKIVF